MLVGTVPVPVLKKDIHTILCIYVEIVNLPLLMFNNT